MLKMCGSFWKEENTKVRNLCGMSAEVFGEWNPEVQKMWGKVYGSFNIVIKWFNTVIYSFYDYVDFLIRDHSYFDYSISDDESLHL